MIVLKALANRGALPGCNLERLSFALTQRCSRGAWIVYETPNAAGGIVYVYLLACLVIEGSQTSLGHSDRWKYTRERHAATSSFVADDTIWGNYVALLARG